MIKKLNLFLLSIYGVMVLGQEQIQYLKGIVENESTGFPMESVHVLNLNMVEGTTTDKKGNFEIRAHVNDTLYFSYLGYKSLKVAVTQDMLKFENSRFQITQLAYALEEIILRPYQLTGYLDIDVKMCQSTLLVDIEFLDFKVLDMKEGTETQIPLLKPLPLFLILPISCITFLERKVCKCKN